MPHIAPHERFPGVGRGAVHATPAAVAGRLAIVAHRSDRRGDLRHSDHAIDALREHA